MPSSLMLYHYDVLVPDCFLKKQMDMVWAFRHVYWFKPSRYIMALVQWKDWFRTL